MLTYLKVGRGNPCAGQIKAMLIPCGYLNFIEKIWDSVEKAGALEPTGSK